MAPPSARTKTPPKVPVIVGGAVALVVGLILLLWGLAPVKGFGPAMDVFGGSAPPEDLADQMDAAMAELGARVWADVLGFVLVLGGIIAISLGKPQEKSVEQQVRDAVEEHLRHEPTHSTAQASPVSPPPDPAPEAPPRAASAAPVSRPKGGGARCPQCGSLKVAGGRICPRCV